MGWSWGKAEGRDNARLGRMGWGGFGLGVAGKGALGGWGRGCSVAGEGSGW